MIIEDGTGNGNKAKVTDDNKLQTESVSISRAGYIADAKGGNYLMSTGGFITLTTTGVEHGIMHLKYNGEGHLHINSIRTCGTVSQKWLIYRDSSTGTLISDATAGTVVNTKLESSNQLDCDFYKGANGSTVTNGTVIENLINHNGHSNEIFDGTLILGKGDSLTLTCELPTTSGDVCVRIMAFEDGGTVL